MNNKRIDLTALWRLADEMLKEVDLQKQEEGPRSKSPTLLYYAGLRDGIKKFIARADDELPYKKDENPIEIETGGDPKRAYVDRLEGANQVLRDRISELEGGD